MKSEKGKTYAQIVDSELHWVFTQADLPEWKDEAFLVVDITGMNPTPNVGDLWDGVQFTKPVKPPKPEPSKPMKTFKDAVEAVQADNAVTPSVKVAFAALRDLLQ